MLYDFDVVNDTGSSPVDVRVFRDITPAADGLVHLQFQALAGQPFLNAIELVPGIAGTDPSDPDPCRRCVVTDHAGNVWEPDNYYTGGRLATHKGDVFSTPDPDLYAGERYGNFSYAIPVPPGRYAVTLHFAETFWDPESKSTNKGGIGSRVFNVSCNGAILLPDFDILKEAKASQAVAHTFHNLRPNGQGKLLLSFSPVVNYASVKAIEVKDEQDRVGALILSVQHFSRERKLSYPVADGFAHFVAAERAVFRGLTTPEKIQRFLDDLAYNKEHDGETCRSPRRVLRDRTAHCMEGALFGAAALRMLGHPPLLLDFEAVRDDDHVLAIFQHRGHWGALAKSNYSGLRYREPVYRTLRELAMSYFEHYYNLKREKTLRNYSRPVNLRRFDSHSLDDRGGGRLDSAGIPGHDQAHTAAAGGLGDALGQSGRPAVCRWSRGRANA